MEENFAFLWTKAAISVLFFLPHHVICGILIPRPGIKPMSPALEHRLLTTGPPEKSQQHQFLLQYPVLQQTLQISDFPDPIVIRANLLKQMCESVYVYPVGSVSLENPNINVYQQVSG